MHYSSLDPVVDNPGDVSKGVLLISGTRDGSTEVPHHKPGSTWFNRFCSSGKKNTTDFQCRNRLENAVALEEGCTDVAPKRWFEPRQVLCSGLLLT